MSERLDFEFVGTTSKSLSLDPAEFRNQSINKIADEVHRILREIAPGVSFFHDDVVLAAEQLANETQV